MIIYFWGPPPYHRDTIKQGLRGQLRYAFEKKHCFPQNAGRDNSLCAPRFDCVHLPPMRGGPVGPDNRTSARPELEPAARPSGSRCQPSAYSALCGGLADSVKVSEREQRYGSARSQNVWHSMRSLPSPCACSNSHLGHRAGRVCPTHSENLHLPSTCACVLSTSITFRRSCGLGYLSFPFPLCLRLSLVSI